MVDIDSISFGEIVIDGKTYYSDMTVWWDGRLDFRKKSHVFDINEFTALLKRKPEVIVVGTGQQGILKIPPEVKRYAEQKKVKLFIDISPKAVDIFNAMVADNKKVVAVMHITC